MQHRNLWIIVALIIAGLQLSACARASTPPPKIQPAQVTVIEGSEFKLVELTEKAAQRLDIQTALVREEQMDGTQRLVVPYAAVIYGLHGETWVYTNGEPLVFVRQPISVDYIQGDLAVLLEGPPVDTEVVTVGVAELYGAETGVSK